MNHIKNTKDFVAAADMCESSLLKAYLGLVAIELTLKAAVNLGNHDVPSALTRLNTKDPKPGGFHLLSLAQNLRNQIDLINVTGKDGDRRTAPHDSYPYIRYTTFDSDGWASPATSDEQIADLANLVVRIRSYLKRKHGFLL